MGAYTEIVDFTFTANETSRTFSGLSITKDDFVKVVVDIRNSSSVGNNISLFANNDTSNSNYYVQGLTGNATTVSAFRINESRLTRIEPNVNASVFAYLKLSENGKLNLFANNFGLNTNLIRTQFLYTTSTSTFTDITSLTFNSNQTNGIGTSSRIQIYKLDAQKVADITVTSNTTQVDISNLSIDKDSEYLLVSDWVSGSNNADLKLAVNDIGSFGSENDTNYRMQGLQGAGSSAAAFRNNRNLIAFIGTSSQRALVMSHIKLSQIGSYVSINQAINNYGSTEPVIQNFYLSGVAENITSITKLNIASFGTATSIGTGSRFTLYKLYE